MAAGRLPRARQQTEASRGRRADRGRWPGRCLALRRRRRGVSTQQIIVRWSMSPPMSGLLGIPWRIGLRLRVLAWVEGVLFLGILFLAIYIKPIWLAALVLLGGFAISSVAWIAILNRWSARHAVIARKVPKT